MEEGLKGFTEHSVFSGILVILCLNLLAKVGEFVFGLLKEKNKISDHEITKISLVLGQNSQEMRELKAELRIQIGMLEREIAEMKKFKNDIQKVFSAIKIIAGPKWPKIRRAIQEDGLPKD